MEQLEFNGNNYDEIAAFTGREVKMGTCVRNCSEKNPAGFDYPAAEIQGPNCTITLPIFTSITKDLQKVYNN